MQYRMVECPGCRSDLRIGIDDKDVGSTVSVRCEMCGNAFEKFIGPPEDFFSEHPLIDLEATEKLGPALRELFRIIVNVVTADPRVNAISQRIVEEEGFRPVLFLGGDIRLARIDPDIDRDMR